MGGLRIESDGTTHGTKVIDIYTGEEVCGVISVDIKIDLESGALATISIIPKELNISIPEDNVKVIEEEVSDGLFTD